MTNSSHKLELSSVELDILAKYDFDININKNELKNQLNLKIQELSQKVIAGEILNPYKMTTIDSLLIQKNLKIMVDNGCKVAILEMSSQGLEQNRHIGLSRFSVAGILNLYPEHIEAHGSLEKYKACKRKLLEWTNSESSVLINDNQNGQMITDYANNSTVPKDQIQIIIPSQDYTLSKFQYGMGQEIELDGQKFQTQILADFGIENAYFATRIITKVLNKMCLSRLFSNNILTQDIYELPGRTQWIVKENKLII